MGEPGEFDELEDFKAYLDEKEARPTKDRKKAKRPDVQYIGPGPEPKAGPFCHLCNDTRRLVDALKGPNGSVVHLCRTCVKQVEWDRAKRCVWCGSPAKKRTLDAGGLCPPCATANDVRANLIELVKLRWVGVIRGD